jgi:hypothetical protein
MTNILHIIPDSVQKPERLYHGSTKDAHGRTEYFQERGIVFDEIVVENRSDRWLLHHLQSLDLQAYQTAIIELPLYPASLTFLRRTAPHLRLLVRSINAELYHRAHRLMAGLQHSYPTIRVPYRLYTGLIQCIMRLRLDWQCARLADAILSITQWEAMYYWRFLRRNAVYVPYFVPRFYQRGLPDIQEKTRVCVQLMSVDINSMLIDSARTFFNLVQRLGQQCSAWHFAITGDLPALLQPVPERVEKLGLVNNPLEVLARSKAMPVLSDYGFGFKTKILDALLCQCFVLVTPGLYRRLPVEVRSGCIVVQPDSLDMFTAALARAEAPFQSWGVNDVLRRQAFATLDQVLATWHTGKML